MRLGRTVVVSLGCFLSMVGCSDDDSGGDDGADDEIDWSTVNPPPNIDITSCYDITYETADQFHAECHPCCEAAGYSASSSLNDDHCTCGEAADDRDTVCRAQAGEVSSDSCQSCCSAAGYTGFSWLGGNAPVCSCRGRSDSSICAPALDHPVPNESCFYCCLQNGFLSAGYSGAFAGFEEECTCISP